MNFALMGVAGFIAPRHLQAIRDTGNRLVAALDPHDAVGVLDRYFNEVAYFREFERMDRHIEKLRRRGEEDRVHFVSICTPNYLHDAHVRFALRVGANAICEKPLVLNPWNLDALQELEAESAGRIFTVLQLRVHPALLELKKRLDGETSGAAHDVELTYVTSRGPWYGVSWKGDLERSGGVATNIGIHFFDMLMWLFGPVESFELHVSERVRASGVMRLKRATVRWFLSIDRKDLPSALSKPSAPTYRSVTIDGGSVEFSDGFADLHTKVYQDIIAGGGCGIEEARPSIELAYALRHAPTRRADSAVAHPSAIPYI